MKAIKKLIITVILLGIIFLLYLYHTEIIKYIMVNYIYHDNQSKMKNNDYKKANNWLYVQTTSDFTPKNKQDILNIFYTALDDGWDDLTFYCPNEYKNCLNDVKEITSENYMLSNINNFVSTYNSYNTIYVNMNNFGRVNIKIEKLYTEEEIKLSNSKINEIYDKLITEKMSDTEKIKTIHDYIINNTVYDQERAKTVIDRTSTDYKHISNMSLGPLVNGKAICGGYTDAMALFLDKMGIKNYKISSETHIWNLVYIDGSWKHLDLTWDDPVVNTGENVLLNNYFLINTDELEKQGTNQHTFNKTIYKEAN